MTHTALALLAAQGWCPWCGDHMGGFGGGGWMMLFWLIVLVAVIALAWSFARRGGRSAGPPSGEDRAEALLRERFARGEIDQETYRRQLDELRR